MHEKINLVDEVNKARGAIGEAFQTMQRVCLHGVMSDDDRRFAADIFSDIAKAQSNLHDLYVKVCP